MTKPQVTIFWFRRDLRLEDNHSLYHAHLENYPVQPIFIFDTNILDELPKNDARVSFIHQEINKLQTQLSRAGSSLDVRVGNPLDVWKSVLESYDVKGVWANKDYEPYARKRDLEIYEFLAKNGIPFKAKKDHVIFEKDEVLKDDGKPYTVYTPFSKKWKFKLSNNPIQTYPSELQTNWHQSSSIQIPTLTELGFEPTTIFFPSKKIDKKTVIQYHDQRDLPSIPGTTRLSLHLRFGTISIRQLVEDTSSLNEKYLNELIWRDFYQSILWHFPNVVNENFNPKYNQIRWRNNQDEFEKWKDGMTGYPIVDAGMRELNETGYMHNRVRMIVASFLTKHLLIDWRWGEAYFAEKLLDFELASNNGGWQWAAGTGVDAQPYFRIFNPYSQTEKFDKERKYIKKWIPEFDTPAYPKPMVDHQFARERCLKTYSEALNN